MSCRTHREQKPSLRSLLILASNRFYLGVPLTCLRKFQSAILSLDSFDICPYINITEYLSLSRELARELQYIPQGVCFVPFFQFLYNVFFVCSHPLTDKYFHIFYGSSIKCTTNVLQMFYIRSYNLPVHIQPKTQFNPYLC